MSGLNWRWLVLSSQKLVNCIQKMVIKKKKTKHVENGWVEQEPSRGLKAPGNLRLGPTSRQEQCAAAPSTSCPIEQMHSLLSFKKKKSLQNCPRRGNMTTGQGTARNKKEPTLSPELPSLGLRTVAGPSLFPGILQGSAFPWEEWPSDTIHRHVHPGLWSVPWAGRGAAAGPAQLV